MGVCVTRRGSTSTRTHTALGSKELSARLIPGLGYAAQVVLGRGEAVSLLFVANSWQIFKSTLGSGYRVMEVSLY